MARGNLLTTLFLSPVIWWAAIGKKRPPHLLRGLAAGALTGLVTQIAPHMPFIWPLLSHRGTGDGEDQAIAVASVVVYLMIGSGALMVGALVGLVATAIERRTQEQTSVAIGSGFAASLRPARCRDPRRQGDTPCSRW
jgi:hypothetical protein